MSEQHSTRLVGPYDHLSITDKSNISCTIPHEVKRRLFIDFLPFRGSVDKILTRSIYLVDGYIQMHPGTHNLAPDTRELLISNLYNAIIDYIITLTPAQLLSLHEPTTTTSESNLFNSATCDTN